MSWTDTKQWLLETHSLQTDTRLVIYRAPACLMVIYDCSNLLQCTRWGIVSNRGWSALNVNISRLDMRYVWCSAPQHDTYIIPFTVYVSLCIKINVKTCECATSRLSSIWGSCLTAIGYVLQADVIEMTPAAKLSLSNHMCFTRHRL